MPAARRTTALHVAVINAKCADVSRLITNGTDDIDTQDHEGKTAHIMQPVY